MGHEYKCATCDEVIRGDTVEDVLKAAAAHNHAHHGGPEGITPEIEAAVRGGAREV